MSQPDGWHVFNRGNHYLYLNGYPVIQIVKNREHGCWSLIDDSSPARRVTVAIKSDGRAEEIIRERLGGRLVIPPRIPNPAPGPLERL